jgi:very-short-patch-repair endonuclease
MYRSKNFLLSLGAIDLTPRQLRVDEEILVSCCFCSKSEKHKTISSLKQNLRKRGYSWRCSDCAAEVKVAGAKKKRRPRKIHSQKEMEEMGFVDTYPRTLSATDAVLVNCYGCKISQAYRTVAAIRQSFKKNNFGYQCPDCFYKKIKNRGETWHSNVKAAANTPDRIARAISLGKAKIKYKPEDILKVVKASGAELVSGDLSSPSNVIKVRWESEGLERTIRIRRFMVDGVLTKPKAAHLNQNRSRHASALQEAGLQVQTIGPKRARITYRGHDWEQHWVNCIDRKCRKMMRRIDIGLKIDELVASGLSLSKACAIVGVPHTTYYRRRKLGVNPVESAMSIKNSERLLSFEGATYNKALEGTAYRPDILIEEAKLIIEVDGLFWHSEQKKERSYHFDSANAFFRLGYALLVFSEKEVKEKAPIVTSMILHRLKKSMFKIGARKCHLTNLTPEEAKAFFIENHLKGSGSGACIGLKYGDDVVAAIRWVTVDQNTVNISRFACKNNWSVPGAYSRLLAALPNKRIINFVDRRHGSGEHLVGKGFEKKSTHIGFEWTDGYESFNRRTFLGDSGYSHGLVKFYDYGQIKYVREKLTI